MIGRHGLGLTAVAILLLVAASDAGAQAPPEEGTPVRTYNVLSGEAPPAKKGNYAPIALRVRAAAREFRAESPGAVGLIGLQEADERSKKAHLCVDRRTTVPGVLAGCLARLYPGSDPRYQAAGGLAILWDSRVWENVGWPRPGRLPVFEKDFALPCKPVDRPFRDTCEAQRMLAVRLRHRREGWTLRVYNTHLASSPGDLRPRQLDRVVEIIDAEAAGSPGEAPPVLLGDFNATPAEPFFAALERRFALASDGPLAGGGTGSGGIDQVWLGRPEHFTSTLGRFEVVARRITALSSKKISDHDSPSATVAFDAPPTALQWQLDEKADGGAERTVAFGKFGDVPLAGDWNRTGRDGIAVFDPRTGDWSFDANLDGIPDGPPVHFGAPGLRPLTGDWNCDGTDTIAVFRPPASPGAQGRLYLNNAIDTTTDRIVRTHMTSRADVPVVGDWNGDCRDDVAFYDGGRWLFDTGIDGVPDRRLSYGVRGDLPAAGDFSGSGRDGIAVLRTLGGAAWHLDRNADGRTDHGIPSAGGGGFPIVGDWNGDGVSGLAVVR